MQTSRIKVLPICLMYSLLPAFARALYSQDQRIITPDEVKKATQPGWLVPLRILSAPHRFISSGFERGLISVEQRRLRERWQMYLNRLRSHGITPIFGGSGEGTGLGGGFNFVAGPPTQGQLGLVLNLTTRKYQEFDLSLAQTLGRSRLFLEGSYQ